MDNPLLTLPSLSKDNSPTTSSDNPLLTISNQANQSDNPLLTYPTEKHPITQQFGNINPDVEVMSGGVNSGTDFDYKEGTPVNAPQGEWHVEEAYGDDNQPGSIGDSTNSGYGNSALLRNTQTGETIRLSHLSKNYLKQGMIIPGGSVVGLSGNTGNATGPHLDVEYKDQNGNLSDVAKTAYSY